MKVVMVGPYPEPGRSVSGGVERVIDTLLPNLRACVDLTLIVPGARRNLERTAHGVPIHYLQRSPGPGSLTFWTVDSHRVRTLVDRLKPDIVHLQATAGCGLGIKRPRIMTIHGIAHQDMLHASQRGGLGRWTRRAAASLVEQVERNARSSLDGVVVISPYVREALPDISTLPQWEIPNPIDTRFAEAPLSTEPRRYRRIISVGRISPRKETMRIIEIALRLLEDDPRVELALCGTSTSVEYDQRCRELARSHPAGSRICFLGNLTTDQLISELDQSAILLMTSLQETAPMAIAEANSRGVPAIAPCAFGIKHMITPGRNGFFLSSGGLEMQAQGVAAALRHSWDRRAIIEVARTHFSPKVVTGATVAAYHETLNRTQ